MGTFYKVALKNHPKLGAGARCECHPALRAERGQAHDDRPAHGGGYLLQQVLANRRVEICESPTRPAHKSFFSFFSLLHSMRLFFVASREVLLALLAQYSPSYVVFIYFFSIYTHSLVLSPHACVYSQEEAFEKSQKYKEGKFILERCVKSSTSSFNVSAADSSTPARLLSIFGHSRACDELDAYVRLTRALFFFFFFFFPPSGRR